MKIKPITLEVDKDLWEKFKKIIPRDIRLVDAIEDLIKKEVEKNEGRSKHKGTKSYI